VNEILRTVPPPPQNYIASNFMWVQIYTASSFMGVLNYIVNSFMYLILAPHTKGESKSHFSISR
jgi:hypothetical protein